MKTKIYEISELDERAQEELSEAAEILRNGGVVAFPTETVYGLGADALNPKAVAAIYRAKGRPADNPLIVHIAEKEMLSVLTPAVTKDMEVLAGKFWPGPLTMVIPKTDIVPDITTGGLSTVAVRMPDEPTALRLIKLSGRPIAGPSANLSKRPSPTKGEHVVQDMDGRIDAIIVGADCRVGIESTIIDLTNPLPLILRPGILTPEELSCALGKEVIIDPGIMTLPDEAFMGTPNEGPAPKAPGMKYTHYAPKAEMIILRGPADRVKRKMETIRAEKEQKGKKVGIVLFDEEDFKAAAHDFFAKLRELDDENMDLILAGALSQENSIGLAVMNRMLKAAGYNIIDV